tara:strand:- start:17414 stop:17683 length:270 start_codon:yes stop_codon:yes gene_type:complete
MKKTNGFKIKSISRRQIVFLLSSVLIIPILGFEKIQNILPQNIQKNNYQTLLKPDGTTVKVKISTIKKAKIIKKNISNKTFLNWLGRKH